MIEHLKVCAFEYTTVPNSWRANRNNCGPSSLVTLIPLLLTSYSNLSEAVIVSEGLKLITLSEHVLMRNKSQVTIAIRSLVYENEKTESDGGTEPKRSDHPS